MDLESMSVDELDAETVRIKTEHPAKEKEQLRAVKAVRDRKVEIERTRDRAKKVLINAFGKTPEEVDAYLEDKSADDIKLLLSPFEELEKSIGVTVEVPTAELKAEGQ